MIIIASLFLILLMLVTASWFIIPLCIFVTELYKDITRSLRWGKRFPLSATLESAAGVVIAFCFSAFGTLGIIYEFHSLWNPEKHPEEHEKTRKVLILVPEKSSVNAQVTSGSNTVNLQNL